MKALVIGAAGQVGGAIMARFAARGLAAAGAGIGGEQYPLDLAASGAAARVLDAAAPSLVFLCSAFTWVDGCEKDPVRARRLNAAAPAEIAAWCRASGSKLVYLSTEYVFDGEAGPYSEEDPVRPVSVYGRTKLEGERACLAAGGLSARTTVVYSYRAGGNNFLMQLIENSRLGRKMPVPADQYSNPTYAPDLADALLDLALRGASGVFNVTGPDRLDRYAFALRACAALGLDAGILERRTTAELGQAAARPLNAGLKTDKLRAFLGRGLRGVDEALADAAALMKC